MLRLALEIPTAKLKHWSPLCDLDFVLAHKVLNDPQYARFFRDRSEKREVILDNSTHEFGQPLPMEDLGEARRLCRADFLIAPDVVTEDTSYEQYLQNKQWMLQTSQALMLEVEIAAVLCGRCTQDRANYVFDCIGRVGMLCFTFHDPHRLDWWKELTRHPHFDYWDRIHILGMSSFEELKRWVEISEDHPLLDFSFDTSKPLKWGVQGRYLEEMVKDSTLRGGEIKSKQVLDMTTFTPEQEKCVEDNIAFLKRFCRGDFR